MSINKFISIRTPIINAIDMMGVDHDKEMPILMTWAADAEKEIGSRYQYEKKIAVLDIKGCAACLPDDAMYLQRAIMGDQGCDCTDLFNTCFNSGNVFVDQTNMDLSGFLVVDISSVAGNTTVPYGLVSYEIQDNKIVFSSNYDGQKVTIQYLGLSTDCDGYVNISENHVEAITTYILYKNATRKKNKSGAEFNEMQFFYKEWMRLCSHARADDAILNESDRMAIVATINNPYQGIGLFVGMRTTIDVGVRLF